MIPQELVNSFKRTLYSGGYNLLLGSGISLESQNGLSEKLRSAEMLRQDLCKLKGVRDTTSLPRVFSLLDESERRVELVRRFERCRPAPSLDPLPRFLWRRLFTFNIDDVMEVVYTNAPDAKQRLVPRNFDDAFEPTPDRRELHAVHLHGWVGKADSGFVFSHAEYARNISSLNPWMHLLSEILATESFVIAGTSLNEVDLEYYLSHRSDVSPRRDRGPSLLIEPSPDAATEADCERYGLTLVKGTFAEFLAWIQSEFPAPPTFSDLVVPDVGALFPDRSIAKRLPRFFSDFRLITPSDQPRASVPSAFLYGRAASTADLDQHMDILRADNEHIQADVEQMLSSKTGPRILIIFDDAGVGKSTVSHRVGHNLAQAGTPVMTVHTLFRIDAENAAECIAAATIPIILVVDGLADHAEQILSLVEATEASRKLVILASERTYRREYLDLVFGGTLSITRTLQPLSQSERRQLIELLRQYGLVAVADAHRRPDEFAIRLEGDPIAVAMCRILNDFRPLEAIVDSLWGACDQAHKLPYLCAALARHCHSAGVRYSILQSMAGKTFILSALLSANAPLRLSENEEDDDYILPMNTVIGERVLLRAVRRDQQSLFEAFKGLAAALAPHVNRLAIMRRSPEARLAGRLFDADKIVKPLLGGYAAELYISCQRQWEWNSRYWEQRALLTADTDLETALRYARQAVAIERHPFTLTTLGKLQLRRMESVGAEPATEFGEAFGSLSAAIRLEKRRSRITVHPFSSMFSGAVRFIEMGGQLSASHEASLRVFIAEALQQFSGDPMLTATIDRLSSLIGAEIAR